jgi:uncharacterized protein (TIGR03000 family)
MLRRFVSLLRTAALGTAGLFLSLSVTSSLHGHAGGHGGGGHAGAYHGGFYHGGLYHGGLYHAGFYHCGFYHPYYGYGFYRPYYGSGLGGFGLGYGLGLGLGSGLGGYGLGGYGLGGYGLGGNGLGGYGTYIPYYGAPVYAAAPGAVTSPNLYANGPAAPSPAQQPPPDNAAHLQLVVPENAEVLFDGDKTNQTGPVREFVSPPLGSGGSYNYRISVRYTDANGKPVNDTRTIHVRANDWFRIDFTRPAPPEPLPRPFPPKDPG